MSYPAGTRCRYKHRGDMAALAMGDLVVTVVRPHPRLPSISCEVEARDGYRTWIMWADLYPLKPGGEDFLPTRRKTNA